MTLNFPVTEWFESSGSAANEFLEGVRDGLATTACEIWQNYPDFVTQNTNPLTSFARGFMNSACSGIQPPLPPPTTPFNGGQCEGVLYDVTVRVVIRNTVSGCPVTTDNTFTVAVEGPISGIQAIVVDPDFSFSECSPNDFQPFDRVTYELVGATRVEIATNAPVSTGTVPNPLSSAEILDVVRQDGQPDTCGDPPPSYGSPDPAPGDLNTTIVIVNSDGVDNTYNVTYNKLSNQYNFPFGFKFNGVNVTVDLGGVTIHSNPSFSSPNNGNDVPPPGSDGGKDSNGDPYLDVYDDTEYPVLPPITVPETIEDTIEYLLCEEGVVETISKVVKTLPGISTILGSILEALANIVEELCQEEAGGELGFPEYYPVIPGTSRPSVVLYYKEFIDGKKQKSTYTSTITHPSGTFLQNFDTIIIPDKTIGQYVVASRLTDGSRVVASGDTPLEGLANFSFCIGLVNPGFVPLNYLDERSETFRPSLTPRNLKCVQLEYYPDGKAAGVSPSLLRVIKV